MTVGQLKTILSGLDDDMPVLVPCGDHHFIVADASAEPVMRDEEGGLRDVARDSEMDFWALMIR